jgi:hypothetical protein
MGLHWTNLKPHIDQQKSINSYPFDDCPNLNFTCWATNFLSSLGSNQQSNEIVNSVVQVNNILDILDLNQRVLPKPHIDQQKPINAYPFDDCRSLNFVFWTTIFLNSLCLNHQPNEIMNSLGSNE